MKKPTFTSIRDQRAAWLALANEFLGKALYYRDKAEPENARKLNDLAKHIRDGAGSGDPYQVVAVEFRSETAGWLKSKYVFPYEREDRSPDLKKEVARLKRMVEAGEA